MSYPVSIRLAPQQRFAVPLAALLIGVGATVGGSLGLAAARFVDPTYRAISEVEFIQAPGAPALSDSARDAKIDSVVAAARSIDVAASVVADLGLSRDPAINREARTRYGRSDPHALQVALLHHVRAERSGATNSVRLEADAADPVRATELADATARALIERSLGNRLREIDQSGAGTEAGLARRRAEAESADSALALFRARTDPVDNGAEIDALRGAVATSRGDAAASSVRATAAASDVVVQAPAGPNGINSLAQLRTQRADLARRLAELGERYDQEYPLLVSARAEFQAVDRAIAEELASLSRSARADARAQQSRTSALATGLAGAEQRRARAIGDGATLARLQREADNAHEAYRQLEVASLARETGRATVAPELRLSASATPPLEPVSPDRMLLFLFGAIAGGLAGAGFAFARRSRRAVVML